MCTILCQWKSTSYLKRISRIGLFMQQCSSMSSQPRTSKVMENLTLHACGEKGTELKSRPVVLLLPWMGASKKALGQFQSLYHSLGFDTLTYVTKTSYFLWPVCATQPAIQLLNFMDQKTSCPIAIHGFSIGGYFYSVMLNQLIHGTVECQSFKQRVKGQVFDSLTIGTVSNMAKGVSIFITENEIAKKAIVASLLLYFKCTKGKTADIYDRVIDSFYNNPLSNMPYLAFFSTIDPLCDFASMMKLIHYWEQERDIDVRYKCWDDTPHCGHHRSHKEEYEMTLKQYLYDVDLLMPKAKL